MGIVLEGTAWGFVVGGASGSAVGGAIERFTSEGEYYMKGTVIGAVTGSALGLQIGCELQEMDATPVHQALKHSSLRGK